MPCAAWRSGRDRRATSRRALRGSCRFTRTASSTLMSCGQQVVELAGQQQRIVRLAGAEMRDLRGGVHARVGASGASDVDVAQHVAGRAQQVPLHRLLRVTLRLPTGIASAFVLDRQFVSRHAPTFVPGSRRLFVVVWDDGHESYYPLEDLRRACPCAVCSGEPDLFGRMYGGAPQRYRPESFILQGNRADRKLRPAAKLGRRPHLRHLDLRASPRLLRRLPQIGTPRDTRVREERVGPTEGGKRTIASMAFALKKPIPSSGTI